MGPGDGRGRRSPRAGGVAQAVLEERRGRRGVHERGGVDEAADMASRWQCRGCRWEHEAASGEQRLKGAAWAQQVLSSRLDRMG